MKTPQPIRALLLSALLAPAALAFRSAEAPVVGAPVEVTDVEHVTPGSLTKANCGTEESVPCLAVPLAVTGTDATGETRTVMTAYPVGPELVENVRRDFSDKADAVLRRLRPALAPGTKAPDHETRKATKQAIWAVDANVKYRVSNGVRMPLPIETKVSRIARKVAERGVAPIVVTSAARSPHAQAAAMRNKIALGDNIVKLYANKQAANEVLWAYKQAKQAGAGKAQIEERMAEVIQTQVEQGVYLSDHLRENAIDIRTRNLSNWQRKQVVAAVKESEDVRKTILETIPPHLHVELN